MQAWKKNFAFLLALVLAATSALGATDRLNDNVKIGQGAATTKKVTFDIGSGSANPMLQSTGAGTIQLSNDGGIHLLSIPTITDTVATISGTETWSNKTLASPSVTTALSYTAGAQSRFYPATGSNYVGLSAPATLSANTIWMLPTADGLTGQVLKTDGSKNLGWTSALTNPMTSVGDMIIGGTAGSGTRLPIGTEGQILRATSGSPAWAFARTTVAKSANYTVTDTDGYDTVLVTTSTSTITITLPAAANNTNRQITVKKVDSGSGTVSVARAGTDTIDGATSVTLGPQYDAITLVSDGTNWQVTSRAMIEGSVTLTASGDFPSISLKYKKIGSMVTLQLAAQQHTITTSINSVTTSQNLNSALIPSSDMIFAVQTVDNGSALQFGALRITTSGTVIVYRNPTQGGTNWTTSAGGGWSATTVSYSTN